MASALAAGRRADGERAWAGGLLVPLFLFFSLFPYMRTVPLPIDTQPTGLALGLLLIGLTRRHQSAAGIWGLGGLAVAALALFALGPHDFSAIRNIIGYLSLFVFAYLFYLIAMEQPERLGRAVELAIIVWFAVGALQMLLGRSLLTFLVSDARTTENRGVTSLAPEPTYYGSQMLFLLLMHLLLGMRRHIVALCILSILLLAMSTQVLLILVLALGLSLPFAMGRRGLGLILLGLLAVAALGYFLFEEYKTQIRILSIIDIVLKNPSGLLLVDASANERFASIYVSFTAFLDNYLLPHGISGQTFYDTFLELKRLNPAFLWSATPNTSNLSGAGRLAFEMGFGFFLFLFIAIRAFLGARQSLPVRLFTTGAYLLLLVSAIPLAHPLLGAVLGVAHAARYIGPAGSSARRDFA